MVKSKILQHPAGCLVISHDRTLLNPISNTYVLNDFGLQHFRCNYAEYQSQAEQQQQALQHNISQEKRELKQLQVQQHEQRMKAQKRQKSGKKLRSSGSQAKILLDFKKNVRVKPYRESRSNNFAKRNKRKMSSKTNSSN